MGINTFNTQLPTALGYAVTNMNNALKDRKSFLGSIADKVVTDTNAFLKNIGDYNTVEAKRYLDSIDPSVITNLRNQGVAEQDIYTRLLGNKGYGNGVQMNDHDANLMNSFGNLNKAEGQKRDIDVANFIDQNANDASILGLSAKDIAERAGYKNLNSTALTNVDVLRNSGREDFLKRLQSDYNASGLNSTDYFNRNEELKGFNPLQKNYDTLDSGKKTYLKSVIENDIRDEVNRKANELGMTPAQVRTTSKYQDIVNQAIQKNNAGNLFNNGDFTNSFDINNPLTQQVNQDNKTQRRDTALDNVRNYMNNIFSKNADIDYDSGMAEINAMLSNAGITGQERTNIENEFKDKIADASCNRVMTERIGNIAYDINAGQLKSLTEQQAVQILNAYNSALLDVAQKGGNKEKVHTEFTKMLDRIDMNLQKVSAMSSRQSQQLVNEAVAQLNSGTDNIQTTILSNATSNFKNALTTDQVRVVDAVINNLGERVSPEIKNILTNKNHKLNPILRRVVYESVEGSNKKDIIKNRLDSSTVNKLLDEDTNIVPLLKHVLNTNNILALQQIMDNQPVRTLDR